MNIGKIKKMLVGDVVNDYWVSVWMVGLLVLYLVVNVSFLNILGLCDL